MKKLIILLSVVFIAFSAEAQDARTAIKGGVNIATFNGPDEIDYKYSVLPHIGVSFLVPLSNEFFFRPEALISGKGGKEDYGSIEAISRMYYLEVPAYLSYHAKLNTGSIVLDLGPSLGFGLFGNYEINGSGSEAEGDIVFYNEINENNIENLEEDDFVAKFFDFGINFGIGYMVNDFMVNFNYCHGISNTSPNVDLPGVDVSIPEVNNRGFRISLSYFIN
jgi:hypothetical protein